MRIICFVFAFRDLGEEIVKLDANLPNRDAFGEAILQYFVFEALNINFQQIDGMRPFASISRVRVVQGKLSLPPAFSHVVEEVRRQLRIFRQWMLPNRQA